VKVDETTVRFEFDVPYPLFQEMMAGDTLIGGGQSVRQAQKFSYGAYSPAHYLKQYLPKYSSVDEANAKPRPPASRAGCSWSTLRKTGRSTPSCRR
jgi:peptide/nickel transport system substrate-binding protein